MRDGERNVRSVKSRGDMAYAGRRKSAENQSYSRFVSLMKAVLPAFAAILLGLLAIWPQFSGKDERFQVSFSALSAREVDSLTMVNARYYGVDNRNQPFTVVADSATEATPGATVVDLEAPKADIFVKDGSWLALLSDTGIYNQPDHMLNLLGKVSLFHDNGYEIHTSSATVDLEEGSAAGDDPVRGQGPFGVLDSEGFRLLNRGERITFMGKTRLVLHPGAQQPIGRGRK